MPLKTKTTTRAATIPARSLSPSSIRAAIDTTNAPTAKPIKRRRPAYGLPIVGSTIDRTKAIASSAG